MAGKVVVSPDRLSNNIDDWLYWHEDIQLKSGLAICASFSIKPNVDY